MKHLPFSVIENRWFDSGNDTVKYCFDSIASIYCDKSDGFLYHQFNGKESLQNAFFQCTKDEKTEIIYLATHGNKKSIGNKYYRISKTEIKNVVIRSNAKKKIKGLFLGACEIGNKSLAKDLLENKDTHLEWIAGYNSAVDWIDGTAIDMIFFSKLAKQYSDNNNRKRGKYSSRKMAHIAASELLKIVPGAFHEYGFNIYFHEKGKLTSMFAIE